MRRNQIFQKIDPEHNGNSLDKDKSKIDCRGKIRESIIWNKNQRKYYQEEKLGKVLFGRKNTENQYTIDALA